MILPTSVLESIGRNLIEIGEGWIWSSADIWSIDYRKKMQQPVSVSAANLWDIRFTDAETTIEIREEPGPTSRVIWSGIAELVDDPVDGNGGGSPSLVHADLLGRSASDAHPLSAITGLQDELAGKASTSHASTHSLKGSDPVKLQTESTGVWYWPTPCISIASTTTFSVTAIEGQIVDTTTAPGSTSITRVSYPGGTNITATQRTTAPTTYLLIDANSQLVQLATVPTEAQRRDMIFLGIIAHPGLTVLTSVDVQPDICTNPGAQIRELWAAIRYVNEGIAPYANGANLQLNITGGHLHGLGLNWAGDTKNPMVRAVGPYIAAQMRYRLRAGGTFAATTSIDPTRWDNAGVLATVGGGINSATNQRIYIAPAGQIVIQYGQTVYPSLDAAISNAATETFVVAPSAAENLHQIGILSVIRTATALNNTAQARFLSVSKFGELSGGSAGATTATLQTVYTNSSPSRITTDATRGALKVTAGAALTDPILELQDTAGVTQIQFSGLGNAKFSAGGYVSSVAALLLESAQPTMVFKSLSNGVDSKIWIQGCISTNEYAMRSGNDAENTYLNCISFSRAPSTSTIVVRIGNAGGSVYINPLGAGFVRSSAAGLLSSSPLVAGDIPIIYSLGNMAGAGPNIDFTGASDGYIRIGSTPVAHIGLTGIGMNDISTYDLSAVWVSKSTAGAYARSSQMRAGSFYAGPDGSESKVVGTRQTGWAAATGTSTRTTFATGSVTTAQLAERVKALIDDLISHGLIGA